MHPIRIQTSSRAGRGFRFAILLGLLPASATPLCAARLRFAQEEYRAVQGDEIRIDVYLDMNESEPGDQPPAAGLFSVGVLVRFEAGGVGVATTDDVILPPELDSNGLGGPPDKTVDAVSAGASGVVPFSATEGYGGTKVLSLRVRLPSSGRYAMELSLFYGEPGTNFLDFEGTLLDPLITDFGRTTVVVEPAIRIAGIGRDIFGRVRIDFESPRFDTGDFFVEESAEPGVDGSWQPIGDAVILAEGAGSFRAFVRRAGEDVRFFRIGAGP